MRFSSIFSVCVAASSVVASSLTQRDDDSNGRLADLISPLRDAIHTMTDQLSKFDGDVVYASNILISYDNIQSIMANATEAMKTIQPEPEEVVLMLKPGSMLIEDVRNLMNGLIAKKPQFDQNQLGYIVEDNVTKANQSYKDMMDVIVRIVPKSAIRVFDAIGKQFGQEIQRAIDAFAGSKDVTR